MGPIRNATSDSGSAPKKQRKVMTLQEKVELLDMYCRLKSAAAVARHFKINESSVRTIVKKEKEIREAVVAATPAGAKTLHFLRDTLLSRIENAAFMWVQDCYKKGIPIDSSMIREKAKLLYDNLKQKEGEGTKAGEFNASKGWFDNFRKRFGLRNVKIAGEAASADREATGEFPHQELIDPTPEELTEGALVEMRASGPVPDEEDIEAAWPENKLTLDNLAEGFRLFKTAFDFFYNMDPSVIRALRLKQVVEEGLVPYRNIFREMKKQRSQTEITMYFHKVTPSVTASPACPPAPSTCPTSATPETARPALLPPHPEPTQQDDNKDEDLPADPLPYNK
ncbi:transmembrane protein 186 isoform X1 [Eumetopias jubatus]|uniref:transmembrane protein 186 isoform X1 n=1 Tax=Eumetopias jubatus TaxID=34886 RepID=UPI00101600BB|nr:transmembrane protein 186 isoform X1 [Eumetopias jubatus]